MKKTLIKTVVIVIFMYLSSLIFAEYGDYVSRTYDYSKIIALAIMLIPGFLCGVILNYDVLLKSIKNKNKINFVLIGVSFILILSGIIPYFAYTLTMKFVNNAIIMGQMYQFVLALMAGYCFSIAFSNE